MWCRGLMAASALAATLWAGSSGLTSPPGEVYASDDRVLLTLPYRGICRNLTLLNENGVMALESADVKFGLARLSCRLPEGSHELRMRFDGPLTSSEYPLEVVVDKDAPQLSVQGFDKTNKPAVIQELSFKLQGKAEPGVKLYLDDTELKVDADGHFSQALSLTPGWNRSLLRAVDRAGNQTAVRAQIFSDQEEPEIAWKTPPNTVFGERVGRLAMQTSDDGEIVGVSAKIDGKYPVTWHRKADGNWVGDTEELFDGKHTAEVRVVDASGRIASAQREFLTDTTEVLGEATLGPGAKGADVKLLHDRLVDAGYLSSDKASRVYSQATEDAIKALQKDRGFEVTGLAEGQTLVALGPQIFINLSRFSLVLDRPGKPTRRWLVASGAPEFATPSGKFVVVEKVPHPTWLPPKSDWAKDAKPVPAGPDNPLGTRWIGLDWGGVGIHGTNAPWTVGTASSHGCLRMVSSQVEELFTLVEVGTPVTILGGWESDPALERYWPTQSSANSDESPSGSAEINEEVASTN